MAPKKDKKNKENLPPPPGTGQIDFAAPTGVPAAATVKKRAKWTSATDSILIDTLKAEKATGNQTDNASWHADAWTAAEKALDGTELVSGGAKKTAKMCQTRWGGVSAFIQRVVVVFLTP
jgi:hypothetical protein